jgi:hypothetical protein
MAFTDGVWSIVSLIGLEQIDFVHSSAVLPHPVRVLSPHTPQANAALAIIMTAKNIANFFIDITSLFYIFYALFCRYSTIKHFISSTALWKAPS